MESTVQFVRVGERYCAVVVGQDTAPKLIIKDLQAAFNCVVRGPSAAAAYT